MVGFFDCGCLGWGNRRLRGGHCFTEFGEWIHCCISASGDGGAEGMLASSGGQEAGCGGAEGGHCG